MMKTTSMLCIFLPDQVTKLTRIDYSPCASVFRYKTEFKYKHNSIWKLITRTELTIRKGTGKKQKQDNILSVTFHKDCGLKSKLAFSFVIIVAHHLIVMNTYVIYNIKTVIIIRNNQTTNLI